MNGHVLDIKQQWQKWAQCDKEVKSNMKINVCVEKNARTYEQSCDFSNRLKR